MNKEELIAENAQLQNQIANLTLGDNEIREELSAILGSYETESYYGGRREKTLKVLSWPQIYFRLGKLKERAFKFEDLSMLRNAVDNLAEQFRKMEKPESCDDKGNY